ncbi:MAG: Sir2 silent information regulator family NAD-dependent deacetylase [Olsenella sp.]|jgi:NAD-dependent SIR2 family protein deacetylase|nr:Sir2 silent information regulator family NAD-dependent deacetylase [Olsenella sp.]
MSSSQWISGSTGSFSESVDRVARAIERADAVLVGAGAGLSTAAGFHYSGPRFEKDFADFRDRFGITDMYAGGFYPFPDDETRWAWWSRMIWVNRYACPVGRPYQDLVRVLRGREHFVLTTNVDHQFQRAGVDRSRLFYTQGDYGLLQCPEPCHQATYDNEDLVRLMVRDQRDMRVPSELVPRCPRCGRVMVPNLRCDDTFVEDEGWHVALGRYQDFVAAHESGSVVLLELGVGANTPVIIKYPFWRMASQNPKATYVQVNMGETIAPSAIADQTVLVDGDAAEFLRELRGRLSGGENTDAA